MKLVVRCYAGIWVVEGALYRIYVNVVTSTHPYRQRGRAAREPLGCGKVAFLAAQLSFFTIILFHELILIKLQDSAIGTDPTKRAIIASAVRACRVAIDPRLYRVDYAAQPHSTDLTKITLMSTWVQKTKRCISLSASLLPGSCCEGKHVP